MIAISSCRQLSANDEVARNTIRANKSWQREFDAIVYFADPDARLASPKTRFIRGEDFPTIKSLVMVAALYEDISCLINADIVVAEGFQTVVKAMLYNSAMLALTSMRYEFEPDAENYDRAAVADHGVDFFAAVPHIWKRCWKEIPKEFRIGHGGWDSWMLGFLNWTCKRKFVDITPYRCIFHPRHGSRHAPHTFSTPNPVFSHLSTFPQRA